LFVNPTNVPATGTASGTIEHQRKLGETVYNSSDLSIQMQTVYETTGAVSKGARYRIAYNFKASYTYTIYVTAAAVENTVGFPTGPYIRVDVNSNGGGGSIGCNGPEIVNANSGGSPAASKLSSNSFQEFQFNLGQTGAKPTLEVTAFPETNGGTKTVRVRKIRIVETAPPVSFTLPSSTNVPCGSTSPVTFTATNVNNSPNVTNYTWNLGANNNWLYNGNVAGSTISTGTTNTITLTPVCGSAQSNVSATVTAGGNNYTTNTSTINITAPSLSITGNNTICTNGTYSVNAPCNSSVSWSASPAGVVTLNASGSQVTVTKLYNGSFNLTATVTACGNTYTTTKNSITSGLAIAGSYSTSYDGGGPLVKYPQEGYNYINEYSYVWAYVGDSPQWSLVDGTISSWNYNGYNLEFYLSSGDWATFRVTVTSGGCTSSQDYTFIAQSYYYYSLAPNPASDNLTIYVDDEKLKQQKIKKSSEMVIQQATIMDKFGKMLMQQKYPQNTTRVTLNTSNLSPDVYVLRIYDGKKWTSIKFIKK
jgi:hypothetical protein